MYYPVCTIIANTPHCSSAAAQHGNTTLQQYNAQWNNSGFTQTFAAFCITEEICRGFGF